VERPKIDAEKPKMTPDLLSELEWRGMIHSTTPGLDETLKKGPTVGYIGFDPTAASLHVGNLATVMLLVHLQRAGHIPIALVGGATGRIGDPSGKSEERQLLDNQVIEKNIAAVHQQLEKFLDFDPNRPNAAKILNNFDWIAPFTLLDFMREVGKHITVSYMMAKDSVQKRLETGLSFTEFCYQLIQGYDFYFLYQHFSCHLQLGGSDQWGNITTGTELIRRMCGGSAHGLTTPLLTKSDGSKFGKSESGNVWLDAEMTSPYQFYQFWLNVSDEEAPRLLKVFSLRERADIESLIERNAANPQERAAQKALAEEMTERIHGEEALAGALNASQALFGADATEALRSLSPRQFLELFDGVPQSELPSSWWDGDTTVVNLLAEAGALPSKSEARRRVQAGGIRVNKVKIQGVDAEIRREDLLNERYVLLQTGKKSYHIAVFA